MAKLDYRTLRLSNLPRKCFYLYDADCFSMCDHFRPYAICDYMASLIITSTPRCNQPKTKAHFTEKPGRNVVNTSKNGTTSTLFKITSWLRNMSLVKPNSKLQTDYFFYRLI